MSLEEIINDMPENMPLLKDSGSWRLMNENMDKVLMEQKINEPFVVFISRCLAKHGTDGFEI